MADAALIVGQGDEDHNNPVSVTSSAGITSLIMSQVLHALTHAGNLYTVSGIANAVPDASDFTLGVTVPLGSELHMALAGTSSGDAEGFIYEASTFTGGTLVQPINRNRVSSNTLTGFTFSINPAVSALGNVLFSTYMPGGVKKDAGGSSGESFGEWLLGAGSYIFRFVNTSAADATMSAQMTFYEELHD